MKELFALVPLLKSIKLSLDADLKRVSGYTKDADDDYIEAMTFSNYELSDMPHPNTNAFHSKTEDGALLYQQTIDHEAKENKQAVKETIGEIYCIEVILDKIEIGLKGLSQTQQEILKLKYWEEKTWNEIIDALKEKDSKNFVKQIILFDKKTTEIKDATACHYPAAYESNGKLYITATLNYEWSNRGAILFVIDLKEVE